MVYPFELAYGFGGMVNMTAQRELLFRYRRAAALDPGAQYRMAGMASAMMLGPLIGGVTIAVFGLGVAFAVPAVLLACSAPRCCGSRRAGMPAASGRQAERPRQWPRRAVTDWQTAAALAGAGR